MLDCKHAFTLKAFIYRGAFISLAGWTLPSPNISVSQNR